MTLLHVLPEAEGLVNWLVGWLVGFYGISTFVGYLDAKFSLFIKSIWYVNEEFLIMFLSEPELISLF